MWGCGRTSTSRPKPGSKRAGPMWSKKMNGPTIRCFANGSTRPTSKPPRSRRLCSMTRSIIPFLPASGAGRGPAGAGAPRLDRPGEALQQAHRRRPVNTPVGDAAPIVERSPRYEVLAAPFDVALHHDAEHPPFAGFDLAGHVL